MPVVSYHTVGGRIRSQATSTGIRTELLPDALTSVVRTTNNATTSGKTIRYKPYGSHLFLSGSWALPRFTWNGYKGFRQTTIRISDVYGASRYYSTELRRFLSRSRRGKYGRPFSSPRCNPIATLKGHSYIPGKCGAGGLKALWGIRSSGCEVPDGWIIQLVNWKWDFTDCNGDSMISDMLNRVFKPFYEGWKVIDGIPRTTDKNENIFLHPEANDVFLNEFGLQKTKGNITITGLFMYVPGEATWDPDCNPPQARDMPTNWVAPSDHFDSGKTTLHKLFIKWNCCPNCEGKVEDPTSKLFSRPLPGETIP